jgi:hypothetical protein
VSLDPDPFPSVIAAMREGGRDRGKRRRVLPKAPINGKLRKFHTTITLAGRKCQAKLSRGLVHVLGPQFAG